MENLKGKSMDLTEDNLNKLKELFPEVFEEGKIDFDKLRLLLGDNVEDKEERYEFTWHGKNNAIRIAQTPSTGTLRPDKESSKNWDDTENLYIEGDNLEVLKLLQKSYFGKVKMIYIDPPYNTGNDFVYKDNFKDNIDNYKKITNQTTRANPETNGRYHTDWINMMYPRLKLARNLLTDDGAIFISISNEEYANLKKICDEIFGENNYIETFLWTKTSTPPSLSNKSRKTVEYIICYEKFINSNKYKGELLENGDAPLLNSGNKSIILKFPSNTIKFKIKDGLYKKGKYDKVELLNDIDVEQGENRQEVTIKGEFKWTQDTLNEELKKGTYFLVKSEKFSIRFQRLFNEDMYKTPTNFINEKNMNIDLNSKNNIGTNETANKELIDINMNKIFDYAKPTSLIKYISKFIVDKSDIILDFFSGSATTAHSVIQLNLENKSKNKFIMVQLPELTDEKSEAYKAGYKNICEIGKERIRRAGDKIVSENKDKEGIENLDIGFKVFKLDSSNLKSWDSSMDNLEQNLLDMESNLKQDRTNEDLLYEILLKSGVELTAKIEEIKVGYNTLYNIGQGALLACLDDKITQDVIDEIPKHKSPFMDTKVIFKEAGFMSDAAKINAVQNLKQFKIEDVRSV